MTCIITQTKSSLPTFIALFCRLPIPFDRLGIVLTYTFAFIIMHTKIILRFGISLLGRLSIPLDSLSIILNYTIIPAKSILSSCIALFCGFSEPCNSLSIVLFYTISTNITQTKFILCRSITLLGGLPKPINFLFCFHISMQFINI